jgi:hypothetical protein
MTHEEADNITIAFLSLPAKDREKVLLSYMNILKKQLHGNGKEMFEKCRFAINGLRSAMQINQSEPEENNSQFHEDHLKPRTNEKT